MSKVLVTGGAGFIGSHLVDRLVQSGHEVVVLDSLINGDLSNLEGCGRKVEIIRGDIRDVPFCDNATKGIDTVFHLAALGSVPRSWAHPTSTHEVNSTGTLSMLKASVKNSVRRFVYAASSSAYGDASPSPKRESAMPAPQSPYAVSKLCAEGYCRVFSSQYALSSMQLRYFNVYGPRQKAVGEYAAAVPKFFAASMSGKPLVLYGPSNMVRDFTFVDDAVDATFAAMSSSAEGVVNVSGGNATRIQDLAEKIVAFPTGRDTTSAILWGDDRVGDPMTSYAELSLAQVLLGYAPKTSLDEGLARTHEWFLRSRKCN